MPNVSKFKIKSTSNFITFLKRFIQIDKNLLIELTPSHMLAKVHTQDNSNIKYSRIPMEDVLEGDCPSEQVKISLYDIGRVINLFRHFSEGEEVFMDLQWDRHDDKVSHAVELTFRGSRIRIRVLCGDMALAQYVSPEVLKRLTTSAKDESTANFPFPKDDFAKLRDLCSMDTHNDFLKFVVRDGRVTVIGKSFDIDVTDVPADKTGDFCIFNKQLSYIDPEISTYYIGSTKMMVKSQETETIVIMGRAE